MRRNRRARAVVAVSVLLRGRRALGRTRVGSDGATRERPAREGGAREDAAGERRRHHRRREARGDRPELRRAACARPSGTGSRAARRARSLVSFQSLGQLDAVVSVYELVDDQLKLLRCEPSNTKGKARFVFETHPRSEGRPRRSCCSSGSA